MSSLKKGDEDRILGIFFLLNRRAVNEAVGNNRAIKPSSDIAKKNGRSFAIARCVEIIDAARRGKSVTLRDLAWVENQCGTWSGFCSEVARFHLKPSISAQELSIELEGYKR